MSETIKNKIQLKRGQNSPGTILSEGEPGYDLKNKRLYIGNGVGVDPTVIPNEAYIAQEIAKAQLDGSDIDLSSYATKEYVNNAIKDVDVDLEGYATEDYVNQAIEGVSIEDVAYYDNENTVDSMIPINVDTLGGRPYSEYATENFVKDSIAEAMLDGEVDLSNYVTKEDLAAIDFPVDSVNGKTGSVELNAADVGARSDTWFPTIADIGAAPSGYGLGETSAKLVSSLDEVQSPGWYRKWFEPSEMPAGATNGNLCFYVGMYGGPNYLEIIMPVNHNYTDYSNLSLLKRRKTENGWQDWEWEHPPMESGIEYRTTERFLGKPIYKKIIEFGYTEAGDNSIAHNCIIYYPISIQLMNQYNEVLTNSSGLTNLHLNSTYVNFTASFPMGNAIVLITYSR